MYFCGRGPLPALQSRMALSHSNTQPRHEISGQNLNFSRVAKYIFQVPVSSVYDSYFTTTFMHLGDK